MKADKIFSKLIWSALILIMLTPIYINSNFFFPYIYSKALAFRILVEVLLLLWLIYVLVKKEIKVKIDWLTIVFFILLVSMFLSSLLGDNFYFSFWSNIERSEGLLLWSHMFILFFILRNFISNRKEWLFLWEVFFVAAQIVVLIGLLQYFNVDFINRTGVTDGRVASTIGNAAYLAGYSLLAVFFGLYLMIKRHNKYLSIYYIVAILIDLFVMVQTGTRGAFVAILASALIFVIYNIFRISHKKIKYSLIALGLILCVLGAVIYVNRSSDFIQNNEALRRMTSISLSERTAQTRLMTWNSAWQGFKEKPILGYGQENFSVVFNKYFNPEIYSHAGSQVWFDRAHNIFLDHLVTGGIIGLLLYSLLILWPLYIVLKKATAGRKEESKNIDFGNQILALAIIAFIVQGIFVFEAMVTYLPLFLIIVLIAQKYTKPKFEFTGRKVMAAILVVYLIALGPIMYWVNLKEAKANLTVIDALHLENVDVPQAVNTYFQAIDYRTSGTNEFRRRVVEFVDGLIVHQLITPYNATQYVTHIDQELEKRIAENPADVANYLLFMRHYNYTYVLDPNRLYKVFPLGETALKYSPTRLQIYEEMGYADLYLYLWLTDQGKPEEAAKYQSDLVVNFQKAIDLNDDVLESYINMVMVLLASHQPDKVQPYLETMDSMNLNYKQEEPLNRMASAAVNAQDFTWSAYFYDILRQQYSENPQYYISLALSYASLGMNDQAIAIAEEVKKFGEPYLTQSEDFIERIKNGEFQPS
ncbi:MAG: hypothetical protein COV55_01080 [Candidatus Komeilibacteria bacterium CG11_big_fil_rev_8_21_14_0_20_36_20]|uniref:O-antigen ligase-related domain-containing protein n=1 Tax=Candidatus Komeilibacteria bacterium CG11_big_fil_rev_8_21_14_0_20_36_20 TaxID=1974477 RepID=A0A2H0NDM8_9BACT|nr:MAG: hypothetical protein COV55_01080 [Candidatus Komeilibacteria bacterium CG11_big_fil_rev_8_21_14_0_20_36_20]PIR81373.1 MAG: hypothetical protein COU21_04050 [Candidatus Komeilibacteria bacterium CG10_big_fil_rev_8_21_14_0_10_36_65]PJC55003.1 MAG: hypothetical protein CO027_04720 [Candidatus Komeilibacteria bacterium CG_4_9_14_0_2_um_filter_36_13]